MSVTGGAKPFAALEDAAVPYIFHSAIPPSRPAVAIPPSSGPRNATAVAACGAGGTTLRLSSTRSQPDTPLGRAHKEVSWLTCVWYLREASGLACFESKRRTRPSQLRGAAERAEATRREQQAALRVRA